MPEVKIVDQHLLPLPPLLIPNLKHPICSVVWNKKHNMRRLGFHLGFPLILPGGVGCHLLVSTKSRYISSLEADTFFSPAQRSIWLHVFSSSPTQRPVWSLMNLHYLVHASVLARGTVGWNLFLSCLSTTGLRSSSKQGSCLDFSHPCSAHS